MSNDFFKHLSLLHLNAFHLMMQGRDANSIADILDITTPTVYKLLADCRLVLHAHSNAHAVAIYLDWDKQEHQ